MNIIWSDSAKQSYERLVDNLLEYWDISTAEEVEMEIIKLEDRLKTYSNLCPKSIKKNLRKCTVHKLTSLIYRVVDEKQVEIVQIIQNRMTHNY